MAKQVSWRTSFREDADELSEIGTKLLSFSLVKAQGCSCSDELNSSTVLKICSVEIK